MAKVQLNLSDLWSPGNGQVFADLDSSNSETLETIRNRGFFIVFKRLPLAEAFSCLPCQLNEETEEDREFSMLPPLKCVSNPVGFRQRMNFYDTENLIPQTIPEDKCQAKYASGSLFALLLQPWGKFVGKFSIN